MKQQLQEILTVMENDVDDRDSDTEDWKEHPNHEDDEDHDYIILQSADLALRKFIIAVSDDTTISEDEYLKNTDGTYSRAPEVDTSKLNTIGEDNKIITTATYKHSKRTSNCWSRKYNCLYAKSI